MFWGKELLELLICILIWSIRTNIKNNYIFMNLMFTSKTATILKTGPEGNTCNVSSGICVTIDMTIQTIVYKQMYSSQLHSLPGCQEHRLSLVIRFIRYII